MVPYNIRIYRKAQQDLEELVVYINQFHTETALSYYDEVTLAVETLKTTPERCPLVRDRALSLKGYRWLSVKNHVIFYTIKGKTVQIRRILYNKRQYKEIL